MELNQPSNVISFGRQSSLAPDINEVVAPTISQMGPIELQMREKLSKLNGTEYPDTFDWSTYDKIAARYGENQPRGGVVFKTAFKLVNYHTSCSKCHYSFEIDSYGRGCVHNCIYCYAKDQLSTHGYWNRPMPFPVDLSEVRKIMFTVFETNKPSRWRSILEQRVPVRIGSMSDSFMWMDQKYGVTKELLRILNYYRYPHVIFTRSDLVAHDDYLGILDKGLASIQFSICGGNEVLTRKIEPGAPSVERRLKGLAKLGQAGFWTTVRINPLFPVHPDGYFSDPDSIVQRFGSLADVPRLDFFDFNFIGQLREAGVGSVLAGFVRLSPPAIKRLSLATGVNLREFFKPELLSQPGDKRYSDAEIAVYYRRIKEDCIRSGMRFSTCYIGNGEKDYYQYQDLWSNKSDCCDVRGNVASFDKTSQSIPWEERMAFAPCKSSASESMRRSLEFERQHAELSDSQ